MNLDDAAYVMGEKIMIECYSTGPGHPRNWYPCRITKIDNKWVYVDLVGDDLDGNMTHYAIESIQHMLRWPEK